MASNPDAAKELRRQNKSYVFFREVQLSDKDEAVGAQGIPLTAGRSIAVDRFLHVYGTPFFVEGSLPIESERSQTPFRRLMVSQDTGSAIVGPARADIYFGAGVDAGRVAGRLKHGARFVMLVPKSLDPVAAGKLHDFAGRAAVGEDRKAVSAGQGKRPRKRRQRMTSKDRRRPKARQSPGRSRHVEGQDRGAPRQRPRSFRCRRRVPTFRRQRRKKFRRYRR